MKTTGYEFLVQYREPESDNWRTEGLFQTMSLALRAVKRARERAPDYVHAVFYREVTGWIEMQEPEEEPKRRKHVKKH